MSEKTYLIKMDGSKRCEFNVYIHYCARIEDCRKCEGDLNNRPDWCSLVEHDIGVCHEEFQAIGDNPAQEAAKKVGW